MSIYHHYRCPNEGTCRLHKHCHVLKTTARLSQPIIAVVKCPAEKREIEVKINI